MFEIGQKIEIGFNAMPEEERNRLIDARSTGKLSTTIHKSRVVQPGHQVMPEYGEIVETRNRAEGKTYLVRVLQKNSSKGRLRVYPQDSPLLKSV